MAKRAAATLSVKPIRDHVFVRPLDPDEITPGGIVLPDVAKEKTGRGTVLAVGSGRLTSTGESVPLEVSEGDTVYYAKYSGSEVTIDGEQYIILREDDVLATIQN